MLPLGISFFTFQTMSYSIDVYRGNIKYEKNFINFMTYVCMFPQLVAGPIVRYSDISKDVLGQLTAVICKNCGKRIMIRTESQYVICANCCNKKTLLIRISVVSVKRTGKNKERAFYAEKNYKCSYSDNIGNWNVLVQRAGINTASVEPRRSRDHPSSSAGA